jgi:hypothetical protein
MKNILFKILNQFPVFHVSEDENFGTYNLTDKRRYSLVIIACGTLKIYLVTYKVGAGFSLWKFLWLNDVLNKIGQKEIDQKTLVYAQAISTHDNEKAGTQYEFLKEQHNNNMTAKASLESRMSAYMTVYFVVIGFVVYLFNETLKIDSASIRHIALAGCALSALFLLSAYIHTGTFLRVKGVVRATFKDLRVSPSKIKQAELAYTNWFASKDEIRVLSTYVRNFESHLTKGSVLAILTWMLVAISPTILPLSAFNSAEYIDSDFEIFDSNGKLRRDQLTRLAENLQETPSGSRYYILAGRKADKAQLEQVSSFITLWDEKAPADIFSITSNGELGSTIIVQKKRSQK